MNKTHRTNRHPQHIPHTLRPVVIAITTALGVSGLLVGCGGGGGGGDNNNSGGGGGTLALVTSGGKGGTDTGIGGDGGQVVFYALADNTTIKVLTSTSGAPDTSNIPAADTGANPLEITTNTTIPVDPADPAAVPYFQNAGDCRIYESNGNNDPDDDTPVTGIEIATDATLKLQPNNTLDATACIEVDNDIVNDGTIKTETRGSNVDLYTSTYFGSGPIITSGACGAGLDPNAGDIEISVSTAIYNKGDLTAAGANCDTPGEGGYIDLYVEPSTTQSAAVNNLWNAGTLDTSGGNSTTTGGGDGGDVSLYLYVTDPAGGGSLISDGAIDSSGGDGIDDGASINAGGTGGDVYVDLYAPTANTAVNSSNLYILAGIDSHGGSATDPNGDGGYGGDLSIHIEAGRGNLELLGFSDFDASGGDGAGGGGSGGFYVGFTSCSFDETGSPTECFDTNITNQANINSSGGDALVSGSGGFAGYIGASIGLYIPASGDINNSGALTANGGAGTGATGAGGDGGGVNLYTYSGNTMNTGTINARGGNGGETGGNGSGGSSSVLYGVFLGGSLVTNHADIHVDGGNGATHGGHGGYVELYSYTDKTENTGDITYAGGDPDGGTGGLLIDKVPQ